jgi:hypothetical protein
MKSRRRGKLLARSLPEAFTTRSKLQTERARARDPLIRLRASLSRGDGRRAVAGCAP